MKNSKVWPIVLSIFVMLMIAAKAFLIYVGNVTQREIEENMEIFSKLSEKELTIALEDITSSDFFYAAIELRNRGPEASESAQALAIALATPRRDSYLAGEALISMGENGDLATPYLIENLSHERSEVRSYSAYALGAIGNNANCAVPFLANLLWDEDKYVRYAAEGAIEDIIQLHLSTWEKFGLNYNLITMFPDEPEGTLTSETRSWWLEEGQYQDWPECNLN